MDATGVARRGWDGASPGITPSGAESAEAISGREGRGLFGVESTDSEAPLACSDAMIAGEC